MLRECEMGIIPVLSQYEKLVIFVHEPSINEPLAELLVEHQLERVLDSGTVRKRWKVVVNSYGGGNSTTLLTTERLSCSQARNRTGTCASAAELNNQSAWNDKFQLANIITHLPDQLLLRTDALDNLQQVFH